MSKKFFVEAWLERLKYVYCSFFCAMVEKNLLKWLLIRNVSVSLILSRMSFSGSAHGWRGKQRGLQKGTPSLKSVTHPTMKKFGAVIPYLKNIQKLYESHDDLLEFCCHQHFLTGNQKILLYQEIHI